MKAPQIPILEGGMRMDPMRSQPCTQKNDQPRSGGSDCVGCTRLVAANSCTLMQNAAVRPGSTLLKFDQLSVKKMRVSRRQCSNQDHHSDILISGGSTRGRGGGHLRATVDDAVDNDDAEPTRGAAAPAVVAAAIDVGGRADRRAGRAVAAGDGATA